MKKAIFFFLILTLTVSSAFAKKVSPDDQDATPTPTPAIDNPFYLGLGVGEDEPLTNWDTNYVVGGEANALFGYALDKSWAVQLDAAEYFFTGTGYSLYQFRALIEAKYTFDGHGWQSVFVGKGWQSYLLAGPGLVFQYLSPFGESTSNFDALLGFGVQCDLAPRTHLFLEAKFNFIMSQSTTFFDIPVSAGIWVAL
jgi:hypothetical protein